MLYMYIYIYIYNCTPSRYNTDCCDCCFECVLPPAHKLYSLEALIYFSFLMIRNTERYWYGTPNALKNIQI